MLVMRHFLTILMICGALAACSTRSTGPLVFPAMVADWKLAATDPAEADRWSARYDGPIALKISVRRMSSGTVAFSMVQSWRGEKGQVAFFRGRYFGVVESAGASHDTMNRFVAAFEKLLPE